VYIARSYSLLHDALIALAVSETYELDYAFASLIFYDHILGIDKEVQYFWTGSWSLSKFLYLSASYALFLITTLKWTARWFQESMFVIKFFGFTWPIATLCQAVITFRIWPLFSRNRVVSLFSRPSVRKYRRNSFVAFNVVGNNPIQRLHPLVHHP